MVEAGNWFCGDCTLEIETLLPMIEEKLPPVWRNFENIC